MLEFFPESIYGSGRTARVVVPAGAQYLALPQHPRGISRHSDRVLQRATAADLPGLLQFTEQLGLRFLNKRLGGAICSGFATCIYSPGTSGAGAVRRRNRTHLQSGNRHDQRPHRVTSGMLSARKITQGLATVGAYVQTAVNAVRVPAKPPSREPRRTPESASRSILRRGQGAPGVVIGGKIPDWHLVIAHEFDGMYRRRKCEAPLMPSLLKPPRSWAVGKCTQTLIAGDTRYVRCSRP